VNEWFECVNGSLCFILHILLSPSTAASSHVEATSGGQKARKGLSHGLHRLGWLEALATICFHARKENL
jgi:hypothetical protein